MELNNAELFSRKAQNYWRSRPRYAEAFFDSLELTVESKIAEMGAGTGILTRELLRRGAWVYAVEPNGGMRAILERDTRGSGRCVITDGFAEASGLPDGSVNLVIAAQSFHWFEPEEFKAECRRVLGGGGRVVLVWNAYRAGVPLIEELGEILRRFCPNFRGFYGGPLVGSSSSSRRGETARARASVTFCSSPPERVSVRRSASSESERSCSRVRTTVWSFSEASQRI